jgi:hypothetical protein
VQNRLWPLNPLGLCFFAQGQQSGITAPKPEWTSDVANTPKPQFLRNAYCLDITQVA